MKSFKNLFIKEEGEVEPPREKPSFPVGEPVATPKTTPSSSNPYLNEIIGVYEKGLESINLPGYDFYDFFVAINAAGAHSEAVYKMAFQMGKTLDSGVTTEKLATDAEYYLSKINEVYKTYSDQGKQKLDSLEKQRHTERDNLSSEASKIESEIARLKQQILALEQKLTDTKQRLGKIDDQFRPQEQTIEQKLAANDQAMQISIQKLNAVREGILKYLK